MHMIHMQAATKEHMGSRSDWQPGQLHPSGVPLPVEHDLEMPSKVAQLAMLEHLGASRLMRTADEV